MKIVIDVFAMMCEHCAKKVEKCLKNIEGIKNVKVDLENKEVLVKFNEKKINKDVIKEAINNAGYEVN